MVEPEGDAEVPVVSQWAAALILKWSQVAAAYGWMECYGVSKLRLGSVAVSLLIVTTIF